jgi:uncharacterized protein with HEPN domain
MRGARLRALDIVEAIELSGEFTSGMTKTEFLGDELSRSAVARVLGIVGEASKHVPRKTQSRRQDVPWRKMAGLRDALIHEYFRTDYEIVWQVATVDLPGIYEAMKSLHEELSNERRD